MLLPDNEDKEKNSRLLLHACLLFQCQLDKKFNIQQANWKQYDEYLEQ